MGRFASAHIPETPFSQDLYISAPRGSALLLCDLHLLFVHTTAMRFELGQSTGDVFHVFCGQDKFRGFDVLLKVLDHRTRNGPSGDASDTRPPFS
jgi:hypothetical protein